jgi:hypothetical protein
MIRQIPARLVGQFIGQRLKPFSGSIAPGIRIDHEAIATFTQNLFVIHDQFPSTVDNTTALAATARKDRLFACG